MGSRQWPLLAARMERFRDQGGTRLLAVHLGRLKADATWKDGPSSTTVGRLVDATLHSLRAVPQVISEVLLSAVGVDPLSGQGEVVEAGDAEHGVVDAVAFQAAVAEDLLSCDGLVWCTPRRLRGPVPRRDGLPNGCFLNRVGGRGQVGRVWAHAGVGV